LVHGVPDMQGVVLVTFLTAPVLTG